MRKARVLLVEDDPDIATVFRLCFDPDRYHTACADTLAGARAQVQASGLPDALLLDVGLPDGNGLMLCRELKAREPTLPVVVITASSGDRVKREARAAGADLCVLKPFDLEALTASLERLLRKAPPVAVDTDAASGELAEEPRTDL